MSRLRRTTALLALLVALAACERAPSVSNSQQLDELVVPAELRLRAGRQVLERGDLDRAFELIRAAPDEPPGSVATVLESVVAAALDAERRELAAAALAALEERAPGEPPTRATALRVADAGTATFAEQRLLDQRVRQLLSDVARADETVTNAVKDRLCSALEGLYWARYQRVTQPAHQIDALLAHRDVCDRASATARTVTALRDEARAAEQAGRPETAIAFHEQVVQLAQGDPTHGATAAESAAAAHRLLWPTYLERTNHRFDRHTARDFAARGLFDEATRVVTVEVVVPVPPGCEDPAAAPCPALLQAAEAALAERFDAVAREGFELAPRSDGPPAIDAPEPTLARHAGATAYFAGSLPLDRLIRDLYDSRGPSPTGPE